MPSKCTWKFSLSVFLFSKHLNKNEKEGTQPKNKKQAKKKFKKIIKINKFENKLKV
jgi:hypothetical protein